MGENDSRLERSEQVEINHVEELDYETFYVELTNDRGKERRVHCQPGVRRSSSPDMSMSEARGNGHTGKYLLALARENEKARSELAEAVQHDIAERNDRIRELIGEINELRAETARLEETMDAIQEWESEE